MEPNNNQPLETNPIAQPAQQSVPPTPPADSTPVASTPAPTISPEAPKGKSNKVVILLIILIILVVGMVAYVLFAKNQMNKAQKTTTDNSSVATPSPTLVPTLAPEEDLEVSNPEADLLEIEADVKSL